MNEILINFVNFVCRVAGGILRLNNFEPSVLYSQH